MLARTPTSAAHDTSYWNPVVAKSNTPTSQNAVAGLNVNLAGRIFGKSEYAAPTELKLLHYKLLPVYRPDGAFLYINYR
jgi:hypothetical protein